MQSPEVQDVVDVCQNSVFFSIVLMGARLLL